MYLYVYYKPAHTQMHLFESGFSKAGERTTLIHKVSIPIFFLSFLLLLKKPDHLAYSTSPQSRSCW